MFKHAALGEHELIELDDPLLALNGHLDALPQVCCLHEDVHLLVLSGQLGLSYDLLSYHIFMIQLPEPVKSNSAAGISSMEQLNTFFK